MKPLDKRFWEIDFLRGIAVGMMLIYHFLVDLEYMKPGTAITHTLFWNSFQKVTASLFLILAGLSMVLRYQRYKPSFYAFGLTGIKIFGWGCLITIITKLVIPEGYVVFGILHLIGLSMILAYPLIHFKKASLWIGFITIIVGVFINRLTFPFAVFVWLGVTPDYFSSIDYFPLFPWFGLVAMGIFLGHALYSGERPAFHLPDYSSVKLIHYICLLGKHTLAIYLIHQPIFLGGIYLCLHLARILI